MKQCEGASLIPLTDHARGRSQERHIPVHAINLAIHYGEVRVKADGALAYVLTRHRLDAVVPMAALATLRGGRTQERLEDVHVIVSPDRRRVITVYRSARRPAPVGRTA